MRARGMGDTLAAAGLRVAFATLGRLAPGAAG
jgi:hypothetical protein